MITTYDLTSNKIQGDFILQFDDGNLITVKMELKQCLNPAQHGLLFNKIPFNESDLPKLSVLGLTITPSMPPNLKLALFCELYEHYVGVKYKVSAADSGKIKTIKVDKTLLQIYFESNSFIFKGKYSIANLVKYYNELRAEAAAGAKGKFPNGWDSEFESKLPMDEVPKFWAHLRSLGLQPKKDRLGKTLDWVKV